MKNRNCRSHELKNHFFKSKFHRGRKIPSVFQPHLSSNKYIYIYNFFIIYIFLLYIYKYIYIFLFSFNLFLSYFPLLAFISRCIHCVTYDEEEISFTSVSVTCTRCDLRLTNDRRLYIYIFIIFLLYIYIFLFFFNLFLSYFPLLAFISRCIHCVTKKKPLFARIRIHVFSFCTMHVLMAIYV